MAGKIGRRPKGRPTAKDAAKNIVVHETVVVTDGRQYRRARFWDLFTALFPQQEEAEWASGILAPILAPIFRERADADDDIKQMTDADIQETFYEAVLGVPFLSLKLRRTVMAELGRSYRKEKEAFGRAWLAVFDQLVIPEIEQRKRESGAALSKGTTYEITSSASDRNDSGIFIPSCCGCMAAFGL